MNVVDPSLLSFCCKGTFCPLGMPKTLTDWPMTGKLLGASFLWSTGLLTRVFQGDTRIVAALPFLNKRDIPQKDKDRLFLERTFTEWIGQVVLTYGLLYFGQDVAAKGVQAIDPRIMGPDTSSLAPSALNKAVEKHLTTPADRATFAKALQTTFGDVVIEKGRVLKPAFNLNSTHNTIYKRLYDGVDLNKLAGVLKKPDWLAVNQETSEVTGLLKNEVNHYFKNLNGLTNAVSFTVMLATAYISGGPLQDWNDHWLREKVAFKMIDWWEGHSPFLLKGPDGKFLPVPPSTEGPPLKPGIKPFDPSSIMTLAETTTTPHGVPAQGAPAFSVVSSGPEGPLPDTRLNNAVPFARKAPLPVYSPSMMAAAIAPSPLATL
jgi:hypothetical protein